MNINNYEVVDRHNRPSVNQRVALRVFFINDGVYQDPVSISGVTIFRDSDNFSPSSLLNDDQLISSAVTQSQVLMHFANSAVDVTNVAFNASNYTPGTTASGIFKLGTGQYAVVLDGTVNLSSFYDFNGSGYELANGASAARDYIDVWTVKLLQGSDYKTVINQFGLKDDTFFALTEPLLLTVKSTITPGKIVLGSKRDIKVFNDIGLQNRNIDESTLNLFRDSVITSAAIEIVKINDESPLIPATVVVSSFANTSSLVDITADNTLTFSWDTSALLTHAQTLAGNMGSVRGTYTIQAKMNILNELIFTTPQYVLIT